MQISLAHTGLGLATVKVAISVVFLLSKNLSWSFTHQKFCFKNSHISQTKNTQKLRVVFLGTYLCSAQTPRQVWHISQVGPWNLGSVQLQVPHSQVPLPLQICPFDAIHGVVSKEQSQALPVKLGKHSHTLHLQIPFPAQWKVLQWNKVQYKNICDSEK